MIPVQRITLRRTTDPAKAFQQLADRLAAYKAADGATFSSVRYVSRANGKCVAGSLFKIPYLPVLSRHDVGDDLVVVARPNFVELAVGVSIIIWAKYLGVSTLVVVTLATLFHVVGYACFKLALGDLRPVFADFVDVQKLGDIGWT
jgi:hypothetical protein